MVRRTHSAERTQRAIADVYKFGARREEDSKLDPVKYVERP